MRARSANSTRKDSETPLTDHSIKEQHSRSNHLTFPLQVPLVILKFLLDNWDVTFPMGSTHIIHSILKTL